MLTTTPSRAAARCVARKLVDRRLAACIQIVGPIESIYRWQGRVETAQEWLCLIKTTRARFRAVAATVKELHPYDTPEIVALPIAAGSQRYLEWLAASVRPARLRRPLSDSAAKLRPARRVVCH
jgi:periplasmic divalent cation tolerance protein